MEIKKEKRVVERDFWLVGDKEFDTLVEAEKYQKNLDHAKKARQNFLNGYNGEKLLQNHRLNEYGVWKISGEDPNCDLGGPHYEPDLGTVQGTLDSVIDYAVCLSGWSSWGDGGKIEAVKIKRLINELPHCN